MAQGAKALAAKPDYLSLIPSIPYSGREKLTPTRSLIPKLKLWKKHPHKINTKISIIFKACTIKTGLV